jgi:hypothetical protein
MGAYASGTSVPVERSRAEIESLLKKYGATKFASGWDEGKAVIAFEMNARRIRFEVPVPPVELFRTKEKWGSVRKVPDAEAERARDQEMRRRFRAFLLVVKAKLEAVASNVSSFETEFLAFVVLPNGATVGQWLVPQIEQSYGSGKMPPLLLP